MRWRKFVLLGLIAAVPMACMSRYYIPNNCFELTNDTGQIIDQLSVNVSGRTFTFTNLQPGETVKGKYVTPEDETDIDVAGQLRDGTRFHESCCYIVWEEAFRYDEISIQPDGMLRTIR